MSNAALAHVNLFDSATVTTLSAATNTPASNLKVADIATKWRSTSGTTEVLATFASPQSADTFMLNGLGPTFLATGTARLRLTSSGLHPTTGDVWDTTVQAGKVDPLYGYLIHLSPTVLANITHVFWDLVQTGASYVEAGRGFIGTRTQFTYNMAPGASRIWQHNTKKTKSSGGQTKIDRASPGKYRVVTFDLGWIDETQRWALHEALDIANGDHTDVLYIGDPASTNLGRDSVWGLVDQVSAVTQPFTIADLYSKPYRIEERR